MPARWASQPVCFLSALGNISVSSLDYLSGKSPLTCTDTGFLGLLAAHQLACPKLGRHILLWNLEVCSTLGHTPSNITKNTGILSRMELLLLAQMYFQTEQQSAVQIWREYFIWVKNLSLLSFDVQSLLDFFFFSFFREVWQSKGQNPQWWRIPL